MCKHWREIYSDYLNEYDYPEKAIISGIKEILVKNKGAEKIRLACYFENIPKALVLCVSNCTDLERISKSPKPSDWIGLEVEIKPISQSVAGKIKNVLRFKGKNEGRKKQ